MKDFGQGNGGDWTLAQRREHEVITTDFDNLAKCGLAHCLRQAHLKLSRKLMGTFRVSQFSELAGTLCREYGVSRASGKTYGDFALEVDNKIFAFSPARGLLVVKLPSPRIDMLISTGAGRRHAAHRASTKHEWFSVGSDSAAAWLAFAREAMYFVRSRD